MQRVTAAEPLALVWHSNRRCDYAEGTVKYLSLSHSAKGGTATVALHNWVLYMCP
jgi:hypothetical protein